MERYGSMAVIPTLTALLLSSMNDLQFFFVFLYALLEFLAQSTKEKEKISLNLLFFSHSDQLFQSISVFTPETLT